jgi:ligand-binding sensor domain-containing protein
MFNQTNRFCGIFLFVFCFGIVNTANAQVGDLTFQHLDIDNGLSENTNAFIYKDSKNFVWIGSMNGLNRFDGHSIKPYLPSATPHSLSDGNIQSNFFEDKKTNLWFSTAHALHCYVRQYDNFDTFRISTINHQTSTVFYHAFYADADERLWVKVEKNDNQTGKEETFIYLFDLKTKQFHYIAAIMPANRCYVLTDKAKNVTSITTSAYEKNLWRYSVQNNQIRQKKKVVTALDCSILNGQADQSNPNLLWFATTKGLLRYNAQTLQTSLFTDIENTFYRGQDVVLSADQRYIYVSTLGQGVWLFDKQKELFINHYEHEVLNPNSLMDNQINSLYLDNNDNLWLSHWGKGLDYTNLHKVHFQSPQALRSISNNQQSLTISNLLEDNKGNIWIGTREKGVFVLEKSTHQLLRHIYETDDDNHSMDINSLSKDKDGNVWILSNLFKIQVYTTKNKLLSYKNNQHSTFWKYSICESELLLSTVNDKWFSVSIKNNQILITPKHNIPQGISLLKEDRKSYLYTERTNTNISIYKKDLEAQGYSFVKNISNSHAVYNWYKDSSNQYLWACTSQGLLRIQTNNLDFIRVGEEHGLKKGILVSNILKDNDGFYWLSTNEGLYQWNMEKKTSRHFTIADGLCSNDLAYYRSQSLRAIDGTIWVATTKGLNYFQPNQIKPNALLPKTEIIDFKINDQPYTEQNPTELQTITLPYNQNTVEFSFASLEYTNNFKNQYQYILEGLDKNWVNAENRNYVRYAALPFGEYTLKIKSCNNDGVWNEIPRELHIRILAPWYFRWWAILFYTLIFTTSIYAFTQYQANKIKKAANVKQTKIQQDAAFAQELNTAKMDAIRTRLDPHFMFNALNSIKEYVLEQDIVRANNLINQFIRLMRALVEIKDNEISLKSELDMLDKYLFLERERFRGKLEYTIYIEDEVDLDYILIPTLTIQPFVENAIKHGIQAKATKGHLSVVVRMANQTDVLIVIEDDGVGRDQAEQNKRTQEQHKSNGIDLVKQRLSLFYTHKAPKNYTITYTDLHNHQGDALGTKAEILLNL